MLLLIFVFAFVASCFLALFLGLELLFFTLEGSALGSRASSLFIWLFMLVQVEILTLDTGTLFLLVWGVFFLCFLVAWMWRESFHETVGNLFSRPVSELLNNFLFAFPIIASSLFVGVVGLQSLQESVGVPTGEPALPENPFETFFLLAYYSLIEEVGFRISPIGLFLVLYIFGAWRVAARRSSKHPLKLLLTAVFYPEKAKEAVGLKTVGVDGFGGVSVAEWVMVLTTSFIFGLAHLLSGIGWDVGKVTSTFITGLVLALAYLAYGFQAPILLHWYFNYYFYAFELATYLYPSMLSFKTLILFLTVVLGAIGLLTFLAIGLGKISRRSVGL